jgi:hypothetical protein
MSFRVILLLSASALWCIFGLLFLYRSSWDESDFKKFSGPLEEIGTRKVQLKRMVNVVFFHLRGLNQRLGIYQSKTLTKDRLLDKVNIGDTLTVYLDDYDVLTDHNIKMNVYHLQSKDKIFLNYKDLNRKHFRIGMILVSIGLLLGGLTYWFYKRDKKYARMRRLSRGFLT